MSNNLEHKVGIVQNGPQQAMLFQLPHSDAQESLSYMHQHVDKLRQLADPCKDIEEFYKAHFEIVSFLRHIGGTDFKEGELTAVFDDVINKISCLSDIVTEYQSLLTEADTTISGLQDKLKEIDPAVEKKYSGALEQKHKECDALLPQIENANRVIEENGQRISNANRKIEDADQRIENEKQMLAISDEELLEANSELSRNNIKTRSENREKIAQYERWIGLEDREFALTPETGSEAAKREWQRHDALVAFKQRVDSLFAARRSDYEYRTSTLEGVVERYKQKAKPTLLNRLNFFFRFRRGLPDIEETLKKRKLYQSADYLETFPAAKAVIDGIINDIQQGVFQKPAGEEQEKRAINAIIASEANILYQLSLTLEKEMDLHLNAAKGEIAKWREYYGKMIVALHANEDQAEKSQMAQYRDQCRSRQNHFIRIRNSEINTKNHEITMRGYHVTSRDSLTNTHQILVEGWHRLNNQYSQSKQTAEKEKEKIQEKLQKLQSEKEEISKEINSCLASAEEATNVPLIKNTHPLYNTSAYSAKLTILSVQLEAIQRGAVQGMVNPSQRLLT